MTAQTRDELRIELQKLKIYTDDELELAIQLAREVGKF